MKKFTSILLLMTAMFTTVKAQEAIDLSAGTFGGVDGVKETYSQWTSENGLSIVSTDANGNEIGAMKYYNNRFQLDITTEVSQPSTIGIKYTITVPDGYTLTEMKVKNSSRNNDMSVDYGYNSYSLKGISTEVAIEFVEGKESFYLRGAVGKCIYITSLTITKNDEETVISEVKGEDGEAKAIYDLTGRRIEEITKAGIYIVNGKKVVLK